MRLVGGPRHADEVELAEGQTSYLDLATADTYYVRKTQYLARDNKTGEPATYHVAAVAVWEKLLDDPRETQIVMSLVMDLAARAWFAENGEEAELPGHLRAQQNGGNSAKVLGADGKVIGTEEQHDESGSAGASG